MLQVVFDMETGDPDDFLTLLFLLGHPAVKLRAVTVTPGSAYQVGMVRYALALFGVDLPVGARNIDHEKVCVSSWHYYAFGDIPPSTDAAPGGEVLAAHCDDETTLITGAPLKNLGAALRFPDFRLGRWVAQGGFAGEGVVPSERQLPKFAGRLTCPTYNLNGDPKSALRALGDDRIDTRYFVSKNVCHGVIYDEAVHEWFDQVRRGVAPQCEDARTIADQAESARSLARDLIWKGMDVFLYRRHKRSRPTSPTPPAPETIVRLVDGKERTFPPMPWQEAQQLAEQAGQVLYTVAPTQTIPVYKMLSPSQVPGPAPLRGKKFHDPLAACCAIDPTIGTWAEVELFRQKGEWGSRLSEGSGTYIITDYDHERFLKVLSMA